MGGRVPGPGGSAQHSATRPQMALPASPPTHAWLTFPMRKIKMVQTALPVSPPSATQGSETRPSRDKETPEVQPGGWRGERGAR